MGRPSSDTIAVADEWLARLCGAPRIRGDADRQALGDLDTDATIARATAYLKSEAPDAIEGDGGDLETFRVAARVIDFGITEAMALELMLDHWNEQHASPPWSPEDLAAKVANAWRYRIEPAGIANPANEFEAVPEAFKPPLAGPSDDDLTAPAEQRKWVVRGMALLAKLSEIIAPPGAGKSSFALLLAVATATGRGDLIGAEVVRRGRVVTWNNEDDRNEMLLRLRAIMAHYGISADDLRDEHGQPMLVLRSGEQERLTLAKRIVRGGKEEIVRGDRVAELVQWLIDQQVVLFIADPLVELHEAAENDNGEMAQVGAIMRDVAQQAACAFLVIHHTRKLPAGSNEGHVGNMDSGRGAGAIAGVARVALTLYGMSEKDAKRHGVPAEQRPWYVRLDSAKANLSAPSSGARWFRRVSVRVAVLADECEAETFDGDDGRRWAFEEVGALEAVALDTVEAGDDDGAVLAALAGVLKTDERVGLADAVRRMGEASPFYSCDTETAFKTFCERVARLVGDSADVGDCRIMLRKRDGKERGRRYVWKVSIGR